METGQFLPWERVFVACEEHAIVGFCTLTEQDALPDTYSFSPYIGFVFVDEAHRGKRISEKLICEAIRYARSIGFEQVYLTSDEKGLYEKYGFCVIGSYKTRHGTQEQLFVKHI